MIPKPIPCPDFIGGEWLERKGGTPVFNPSTGDIIAECPAGGAAVDHSTA